MLTLPGICFWFVQFCSLSSSWLCKSQRYIRNYDSTLFPTERGESHQRHSYSIWNVQLLYKNKNISVLTKYDSERANKLELKTLPHTRMCGYLNNGVTRYGCGRHGTLVLVWPKWIQHKIWMKSKPPSNPQFICFKLQVPIKNTFCISSNLQNTSDKVKFSAGSCLDSSDTAATGSKHPSLATGQHPFQSHLLIYTSHTKQQ